MTDKPRGRLELSHEEIIAADKIDVFMYSIAISLKRIADRLDDPSFTENIRQAIYNGITEGAFNSRQT